MIIQNHIICNICVRVYLHPKAMPLSSFDGTLIAELIWRTFSWLSFQQTPEGYLLQPPVSRVTIYSSGRSLGLYVLITALLSLSHNVAAKLLFLSLKLPVFFPRVILTPQTTGAMASVEPSAAQPWGINWMHTTVGEEHALLFRRHSELCFTGWENILYK